VATFWHIVKLDLFYSLPQTFMIWALSFSLLEQKPERLVRKLVLLTVTTSVYTDALVFFLPFQLHVINSMLANAAMLFLLFRSLPLKHKLGIFVSAYLIAIITDLLFTQIAMAITSLTDRDAILQGPLWVLIVGLYPVLLAEGLLALYIRKKKLKTIRKLFTKVVHSWSTGLGKLVVLVALQFILLGLIQFFHADQSESELIVSVLVCAAIVLSLISLVSVVRLLASAREEAARMAQEVYVEDISRMFTSIRGQRHDFLNHVQVMHTMLKLGKSDELKAYMADIVKDIQDVSGIVHHPSPPLAAFLKAKTAVAESRNIKFTCELSDTWNDQSTIRTIDVVKIVGNLVNNAFDEVEQLPPEERRVHADIRCHPEHIELVVNNRGRVLSDMELKRIFKPGYTTKRNEHSGLGLSIVHERVNHYKGTIDVQSNSTDGTTFRITLPHKHTPPAEGSGSILFG